MTNREEYFPFGETSFGSYTKKRYRFCGKERDEESGLYYYGARYYMPWQCRFVSVDPLAGEYPFYTPYQYASNKPIVAIDLDGLETPEEQNTGMEADGQGNNPYEGMEQFAEQPVMSQDNIPSGEIPDHELDQHIPNYNIEGITITAKVDKNGPQGTTRNYKQEGTPDLETGVDLYTYQYEGVDYHIRSYNDYSSADWSQKKWEFSASETPGEGDWTEFHPNEYNFQDALVIAVESQKLLLDETYEYGVEVAYFMLGEVGGLAIAGAEMAGVRLLAARSQNQLTRAGARPAMKAAKTGGQGFRSLGSASKGFSKAKIPKGFKEVKDFGYQHGQKVYEYKGKYYSRDFDGHNGGVWKVFKNAGGRLKRIGTADGNLNIFKN